MIITSFILRLHTFRVVNSGNFSFDTLGTDYPAHLENVRYWTLQDMSVISITLVVSYFKLFKFFELNDQLNLLTITLSKSAANLGSVIITLLLTLSAYSMTGWIIFGGDNDDFKDFQSAFSALLRLMIGENEAFDSYYSENRISWIIFYLFYMCTNFLICINMVFAVIEGNFTESIPDVLNQSAGVDFTSEYARTKRLAKKFLYLDRGVKAVESNDVEINQGDDELIEKLKNFQIHHKKNEITADDVRKALKGAGEETIKRIMDRYDFDGDGMIQLVELERISNKRNRMITKREDPFVIQKDPDEKSTSLTISNLEEQLNKMEDIIRKLSEK